MINENITPAIYALIPPQSDEEAASRIAELMSGENLQERLIYVVFNSIEQLSNAMLDCKLVLTRRKKEVVNQFSRTHFLNMVNQDDLSEYHLIINENPKEAKIINCIMTSEPKIKRENKTTNCLVCGSQLEIGETKNEMEE